MLTEGTAAPYRYEANNCGSAGRREERGPHCAEIYLCAKARVSATMFSPSETQPFGMSFPLLLMMNCETVPSTPAVKTNLPDESTPPPRAPLGMLIVPLRVRAPVGPSTINCAISARLPTYA